MILSLESIRKLREKISPTPWRIKTIREYNDEYFSFVVDSDDKQVCDIVEDRDHNPEFIAKSPEIVDFLLKKNENLLKRINKLEAKYEPKEEWY